MNTILEALDLSGEQAGAGSGSFRDCSGQSINAVSPIDGKKIGTIHCAARQDYAAVVERAVEAFKVWQMVPAPKRGDIVRQIGLALRRQKENLGRMVTLETGKILAEAQGEVQEMIDMADFAVGQSRMLYGLTMPSERRQHRMFEQWHPLGPVGVITAFNFPVAVWSWNAFLAMAAGDTVIWKPSSKAALTAIAVMKIVWPILKENGLPDGVLNLVIGAREEIGEVLLADSRIPLISATGSVRMGRHVAGVVAARLGKTILELGGNNAIVVTPNADLELALRAVVFGAVGTAGQRCTTTRRLIVHADVYDQLKEKLIGAYARIKIGNPLEADHLMGPLIDVQAVRAMQSALIRVAEAGGKVLYGGEVLSGGIYNAGTYVKPSICEAHPSFAVVQEETFAPILYLLRYHTLEEAIAIQNGVPQGLSSAIITRDLKESEMFLSHGGSDCGIANVNIGTSGAEIGGAFGGEKETGGGREAGSDAWKAYMRRQTCTVNWSGDLPLAQGISFSPD